MTTPLHDVLLERIERSGPMPFAAYMQLALYHHEHGYYAGGQQRTGWSGHFVTSAEIDPAFGALWARGFEEVWRRCDSPETFHLVEVGPGEGGFAAAVLAAVDGPFAAALHIDLVERVSENEARQRALLAGSGSVSWHASVTEVPAFEAGCWFANEILDNLPTHLVEYRDGRLWEVCVGAVDGALAFELRPPGTPELEGFLRRCGIQPVEGQRIEIPLAAESLIARAARGFTRGAAIFVDYGLEATEVAAHPAGTLVCYSASGSDDLPLERPGEKDITSHANWTSVRLAAQTTGLDAAGPVDQRDVLKNLGLDELHESGRAEFARASAAGEGAAAMRALSRRQALGVLADRNGLGGLGVMTLTTAGIGPLRFMAEREEAGPKAGLSDGPEPN